MSEESSDEKLWGSPIRETNFPNLLEMLREDIYLDLLRTILKNPNLIEECQNLDQKSGTTLEAITKINAIQNIKQEKIWQTIQF